MIGYLVDTNVLSELAKPAPNSEVSAWFSQVSELELFTLCLVLGETEKGIMLLEDDMKRRQLTTQLQDIQDAFEGRIISLDVIAAKLWGDLTAEGSKAGRTPPVIDAMLAAQCLAHNLTLVTRNLKDFEQFDGLQVYSPWA